MIASHSLRRSGLALLLGVCWSSFAYGDEEFQSPPAPANSMPAPIPDFVAAPDSGLIVSESVAPAACQCRHCKPAPHQPRGVFGWFRGRSADDAEYHAMCSGCNVHPEPPFGTSFHAAMQGQIAKGEAALMVLHHFDFVPCQATLNYRGRQRLQKIAQRAAQNPFPIIIEASRNDPALDAARQAAVISELVLVPCPVPAERIVIGLSPARGLDGLDAELIHGNLLRLTAGGGAIGEPAAPSIGPATGGSPSP